MMIHPAYRKIIGLPLRRYLHTAYIIKPCTGALEQEKQACYLTKTLLNEGSPPNQNNQQNEELIKAVRNSIIETMYFQRDEVFKFPKRMRERTRAWKLGQYKSQMSSKVLMNLLRVIWSSAEARSAGVLETTLSYRPDLVAPWERFGEKIQVSGKYGHLVSGRKLLPLFADEADIERSRDVQVEWDDVISPFFDIHPLETQFEANRGFHPDAPFPCPQKLLTLNNHFWKPSIHFGQGLFYSFAHAMTYALENGGVMGEELLSPVPMQYVSFNGTSLYFVWYQLNTLNFNEHENSVKNLAWTQELRLYDNVTEIVEKGADGPTDYNEYVGKRMSLVDFDRKKLSETLDNKQSVKVGIYGFNEEAASKFIEFMLSS